MTRPVRTLLVWCPDWPVIAAEIVDGTPASAPVAVVHANRVVACSPAARREGVTPGVRRREAQSRCPWLTVLPHDPGRDTRAFEPVVAAVEQVAAGVAVLRPGSAAVAARGPAGYFGSEERAAERVVEQIAQECEVEARVGIADGMFAAGLAARAGRLVPAGGSAEFLAGMDLTALDRPALADRLRRLGVRTLGEFAALPAGDVLARFGFDAGLAHRLAAGADQRPLPVRRPPPELAVTEDYDDPLDRVDVAAFAARALARRLHDRLAGHGLACLQLAIEAVTERGEQLRRSWRHDGMLTVEAVTDRVRWQLEGWLATAHRGGHPRPTAGICRLRLVPEQLLGQIDLQPGLWGEAGAGRERAGRAFARVQGLLGPGGVVTAALAGGRGPADRVRLVPWGEQRPATGGPEDHAGPDGPRPDGPRPDGPKGRGSPGGAGSSGGAAAPWPGRLPSPSPSTVLVDPSPAEVIDAAGRPVRVDARSVPSAAPARVRLTGELADRDDRPLEIIGWAGPWPVDERWWAPAEARRAARFQVLLDDGRALLLAMSEGAWRVEAVYD